MTTLRDLLVGNKGTVWQNVKGSGKSLKEIFMTGP